MRKIVNYLFILFLLFFISCDSDNVNDTEKFPYDNFKLSETISTKSDCLFRMDYYESTEIGNFFYTINENSIGIKHQGIYDHCEAIWCFEMEVTTENKIIIKEIDKSTSLSWCVCRFDISTSIVNIYSGLRYEIEIWNDDMTELLDSRILYKQ